MNYLGNLENINVGYMALLRNILIKQIIKCPDCGANITDDYVLDYFDFKKFFCPLCECEGRINQKNELINFIPTPEPEPEEIIPEIIIENVNSFLPDQSAINQDH